MDNLERKFLSSLAKQYPTIPAACTEIINLKSILNLPKGTEHFLTDLHGEYEQFNHVLRNGSGAVKRKIDEVFENTLSSKDKKSLAALIYYPEEKTELIAKEEDSESLEDWYKITLYRLINISRRVASKYTRSKVRKAQPKDFSYIIEELLHEKEEIHDKEAYYNEIISTIIEIGRAREFIIALCNLIQRLVIDHLHIVGDIFDRGKEPHRILDTLIEYHSVDIQWGNHDVLWIGAASGHMACIANVIRIAAKYGTLDTLEDGYGINMLPLATYALKTYEDDPCTCFSAGSDTMSREDSLHVNQKMHKAISVIQFKLEGQIIRNRPDFQMQNRLLMDKINYQSRTVEIDGINYPLKDCFFPTVSGNEDPYALTEEEEKLMDQLKSAFLNSEKLQKHIKFIITNGSLYLIYNSNLLYHGCIPFNEDGSFREVSINDKLYSGKALYDILEHYIRKGYYSKDVKGDHSERDYGLDIMWYTWSNENSPVYGKAKMATFERYFLTDDSLKKEAKDYYYSLIEKEEIVDKILTEFGLDRTNSHIINGHMPVQLKKGETPIKCNGKLLIIDGGFSKAYQKVTGIAGYTLTYNSYGLNLVSHEPFKSREDAIANERDIHSEEVVVERVSQRRLVSHTDIGSNLRGQIADLKKLLNAYRSGEIRELT